MTALSCHLSSHYRLHPLPLAPLFLHHQFKATIFTPVLNKKTTSLGMRVTRGGNDEDANNGVMGATELVNGIEVDAKDQCTELRIGDFDINKGLERSVGDVFVDLPQRNQYGNNLDSALQGLDVLVHRGICEAAKGIYEQMLPEVRYHVKNHGNHAMFHFIGNSLGGSLSLLVNLMLLIRGDAPPSLLLPIITFGAPAIMCGGDRWLQKLGLPKSHVQSICMHRDIVPRAFFNHVCNLCNHGCRSCSHGCNLYKHGCRSCRQGCKSCN